MAAEVAMPIPQESAVEREEPAPEESGDEGKESLTARLRQEVAHILEGLDLASTTLGQVRTSLEANLGLPTGALDSHKDSIRALLEDKIQQMQHGEEELAVEEEPEESKTPLPKKEKKRKRRMMQAAVHLIKKYRRAEPMVEPAAQAEIDLGGVQGPLRVTIGGVEVPVPLKTMYSGRPGFHTCLPVTIEMEGRQVEMTCMVSCAINSCKEPGAEDQEAKQQESDAPAAVAEEAEEVEETPIQDIAEPAAKASEEKTNEDEAQQEDVVMSEAVLESKEAPEVAEKEAETVPLEAEEVAAKMETDAAGNGGADDEESD